MFPYHLPVHEARDKDGTKEECSIDPERPMERHRNGLQGAKDKDEIPVRDGNRAECVGELPYAGIILAAEIDLEHPRRDDQIEECPVHNHHADRHDFQEKLRRVEQSFRLRDEEPDAGHDNEPKCRPDDVRKRRHESALAFAHAVITEEFKE